MKLIVLNSPPNLTDKEKSSIMNSFGSSSQYQSIENITKRILIHILNLWDGNKTSAYPSAPVMTPDEVVALKLYSIELKWY